MAFAELYSKEAPYFQKCLTFLNQMGPDVEVEIIEEGNRFRDSFAQYMSLETPLRICPFYVA